MVPVKFSIKQKKWWVILLESKWCSDFVKSVVFKWCYSMDFNLHAIIISIKVYNANTDSWNRTFARFVVHSRVVFCNATLTPDLTIERNWWSIFLQKNWFPLFLELLNVIWSYCMSIPKYCMECLVSVEARMKILYKFWFNGKHYLGRLPATRFFRWSRNLEYVITEENCPALHHRKLSLQYYYATLTFSSMAWPILLKQLDMRPFEGYGP